MLKITKYAAQFMLIFPYLCAYLCALFFTPNTRLMLVFWFFGYARRLMYARALGFVEMLDVCFMYFCGVVGYDVDNCLKKNQTAPRPSEHPPVGGEKMSKRLSWIKVVVRYIFIYICLCLSRLPTTRHGDRGQGTLSIFRNITTAHVPSSVVINHRQVARLPYTQQFVYFTFVFNITASSPYRIIASMPQVLTF